MRKRQEPVVNFVLSVQKEIKSQLPAFIGDEAFSSFIQYQKEKLDELRKIERKYKSSTSEEKKGEILEEERKLLKKMIARSLLRREFVDDAYREIRPGPKGQTGNMETYFNSLSTGLKYWQTLQKQAEMGAIFDPYAEDFEKIESYEKKLEECKYYKGFYFHSIGKWEFRIVDNNDSEVFSHVSPMLCLCRREENVYYPYKYMIICVDFEMEGGGASEKGAYKDLETSFNSYFRGIFKENDRKTGLHILEMERKTQNIWKETFNELAGIGEERNVQNKDHQYCWNPDTGVSNG
ncbi:MAG: hypothetical protein LBH43_21235 [Treponema sp.]|nr:hypothetical protein [Treponema sp.]